MPYVAEELVEPFWAEYTTEAGGRDPLAIQNSSVVIYAKMVVGITNVTNRIRYNGFYCWLFDTILKNIEKRNLLEEQIKYTRRAELLLANLMVSNYPQITGVSGSSYAARHLKASINLRAGADWDTRKETTGGIYWAYRLGVFGQYYAGVVKDLNLINHPAGDLKIYTLTDKGRELGQAFEKNIPPKEKKLFWESVTKGKVSEDDLENLRSFALHLIPAKTPEHKFYENVLLSHDDRKSEPTFHRKNTIHLILQFLTKEEYGAENLTIEFLRYNYRECLKKKNLEQDTSSFWYLFEINELLHLAFEHFHGCFLYSTDYYPTLIDECLNNLVKGIGAELKNENTDSRLTTLKKYSEILKKNELDVHGISHAMQLAFKDEDYGSCLCHAIKVILTVYNNNECNLALLKDYSTQPEYHFNRTGNAIELLEDLVGSKWNLSIDEYAKAILLLTINLHTFSSYTKSRIGQGLVHNYIIEDNGVRLLRETQPRRTTPRLQNVTQYMVDVGWLSEQNGLVTITKEGEKILNGK